MVSLLLIRDGRLGGHGEGERVYVEGRLQAGEAVVTTGAVLLLLLVFATRFL